MYLVKYYTLAKFEGYTTNTPKDIFKNVANFNNFERDDVIILKK